jgi:molybdate transport system ATP-binding protein
LTVETTPLPLAVVVYSRGAPLEEILAAVRDRLMARGDLCLGGVVPRFGEPMSNGRNALLLDDIGRGDTIVISQDRGPGSAGCILDADGFARARARIAKAIEARPDVLFLGRFAKEEAAGHGIREEIGQAVVAEIPCLVAVERRVMADWTKFAGDAFVALPAEVDAILRWVESVYPVAAGRGLTPPSH